MLILLDKAYTYKYRNIKNNYNMSWIQSNPMTGQGIYFKYSHELAITEVRCWIYGGNLLLQYYSWHCSLFLHVWHYSQNFGNNIGAMVLSPVLWFLPHIAFTLFGLLENTRYACHSFYVCCLAETNALSARKLLIYMFPVLVILFIASKQTNTRKVQLTQWCFCQ